MRRLAQLAFAVAFASLIIGCGSSNSAGAPSGSDAGGQSKDAGVVDSSLEDTSAPSDAPVSSDVGRPATLNLQCAATTSPINPNPCPAPSGASGQADFCYRPEWGSVTSVEVYGGFGQSTDWTMPFLTLTNDGSGTFTGSATLATGTYPYVFYVTGGTDNLIALNKGYFNDEENPRFEPPPDASPFPRSVSVLTVPQSAPTIVHVKGTVTYEGEPQPCFAVNLESGELVDAGHVESEHGPSNVVESLADGTFDFPVAANAPYDVIVRFPFHLADAGYPDPSTTPSVGVSRTTITVGSTDDPLNPSEISYPFSAYAAMSPTGGSATLPVTFTFTVVPGSAEARMSVTSSNAPGDDPAFASGYSTATSVVWDGGFNGSHGGVVSGSTYYWGAWQQRTPNYDGGVTWVDESLLFPIVFP